MEVAHVAAALVSALLHAGWNASVKASARPVQAMAAQMILSATISVPGLVWSGLPAQASWMWIAASTTMNVVAVAALLRAYELGGFGVVYPVVRAVSVLLVVPLAAGLAGEGLGVSALVGIGLVASSLGLLAFGAGRDQSFPPAALGWTAVAGLATAAFILCDATGVRQAGSPWAYGFATAVTNAAAMSLRQRRIGPPWRIVAATWRVAAPAAIVAMTSYLLILWVFSQAPIAPASALRDTSAVFAILIAVLWLREPFTPLRMVAVVLAAAAVPLLRLA